MPRTAYVNGRYLPHRQAAVHIEDRGYQFADGVYEVVPVYQGTLVDEELHLDRLERSLGELRIALPMARRALKLVAAEIMRRNGLTNGFVYMQVTRGVAPRDHKFPRKPVRPAVVMTVRQTRPLAPEVLEQGIKIVTLPDIRWQRRDIKSTSLLPNCLAKQQAYEAGAFEAWLVEPDGLVTEGASTNAWIVTKDGKLVTRSASNSILNGITRISLLKVAAAEGVEFEERAFTVEEALEAREAFITASSIYVLPVTEIDGRPVGNGHPGMLSRKLREAYIERVARTGTFRAEAAA
ncbi:MAG: D-amino-acid transaminase [Tistlia sp.]|uniref:D-amino-acid transaminase n=1 Tax=Tistlia sp. TaxID=3057121 RepID=UPI0034A2881D